MELLALGIRLRHPDPAPRSPRLWDDALGRNPLRGRGGRDGLVIRCTRGCGAPTDVLILLLVRRREVPTDEPFWSHGGSRDRVAAHPLGPFEAARGSTRPVPYGGGAWLDLPMWRPSLVQCVLEIILRGLLAHDGGGR